MSAKEFLSKMLESIRNSAWSKIDEEVTKERLNNIALATLAMVEAKVHEKTVKQMLIKYWNLRPSEADEFYQYAIEKLSK